MSNDSEQQQTIERDVRDVAEDESSSSSSSSRATSNASSAREDRPSETRRSVHLVLQGKGGVGKSMVASLIAQQLKEQERAYIAFDTDPVQGTFSAVASLGAERVTLLDDDNQVNVEAMDACVSRILTEDVDVVIDNGAASFVPVSTYLVHDGLIELIAQYGKRIVVHSVVVGGEAMVDTILALEALIDQFHESVEIVVWLNPYFGAVTSADGQTFEESATYQMSAGRIAATIRLPELDPHYAGACFRRLLARRMTFAEAKASDHFNLINKLRLANVWAPIKTQLEGVV